MFLSNAYFQGELYLPNLTRSAGTVGVASVLQVIGAGTLEWYIDRYEKEFLSKLLGDKLAENLMEAYSEYPVLTADGYPVVDGVQDLVFAGQGENQIWVDLYHEIFRQWNDSYFSPAANYVYYWICRRGRTQTSMNGEVRGLSDFTEVAADTNKLVKVWNDMLPMVARVRGFVMDHGEDYIPYSDGLMCKYQFKPMNVWNL